MQHVDRNNEMTQMRRVERPAKQSDTPWIFGLDRHHL